MAKNSYNKIALYGTNCVTSGDGSVGFVYSDTDWLDGDSEKTLREKGATEGIASSKEFNTVLRQCSLMSSVFANILAERNESSKAYSYMETKGIGTEFDESEGTSLDDHISSLSNILNKTNFLLKDEVVTDKIMNLNVTTSKIANNAITKDKLGSDLIKTGTTTANGITVTLSQNSTGTDKSLILNLQCSAVTNSDKIKVGDSVTNKIFVLGSTGNNNYYTPNINTAIYLENGKLNTAGINSSDAIISSSYIQGSYFNATSDIRKKEYAIPCSESEAIKNIVEQTPIYLFNYKGDPERNLGIIAQQVADKNIERFNLTSLDSEGYYTIKETKIPYILWKYIQDLNVRIVLLEDKIKQLGE